jgi:DNA-binding response OmpR family regulator
MNHLLTEEQVREPTNRIAFDCETARAGGAEPGQRTNADVRSARSECHADRVTSIAAGRSRVLLAEDDDEMRALLAWALRKAGYEVGMATDGLELLVKLGGGILPADGLANMANPLRPPDWDLVISDIRMPAISGLEILERARTREEFPPIILITAFGDDATHAAAERLGAVAIFDKPFDTDALLAKVREAVPVYGSRRRRRGVKSRGT